MPYRTHSPDRRVPAASPILNSRGTSRQNHQRPIAQVSISRDQAQFAAGYLRATRIVSQLPGRLDDMVHAPAVSLRHQSAVSIHGESSSEFDIAVLDEIRGAAAFRVTQCLEFEQHDVREAIINLQEIH